MSTFAVVVSRRLGMLGLVFVMLAGRSALATDFCVETPAQLHGALLIASVGEQPDDDVTIKLVRGAYAWPGPGDGFVGIDSVNRLRLLGGYNAGCTTRVIDANNTAINGAGSLVLSLGSSGDDVLVEGVRFNRLASLRVRGLSGVGEPECEARGRSIVFRRSIVDFTGSSIDDFTNLFLGGGCHDLRVENNLVIGGFGNFIYGGSDDDALSAVIANNTIVDAQNDGLTVSKGGSQAFLFNLYNNIFWNNGGLGLEDNINGDPVSVVAYNNTWDGNGAPLLIGSGNSTTNPQLDANRRPVEPSAPAINSGSNAVPGGMPSSDLDGGPRLIGSTIDRGAYESAIDNAFTLTVTNANDSGAGSLRQAILSANATAGFNRIEFAVPASAGQCVLLQPASPYPDITDALLIDGFSQPGASRNTLDDGDNATICVRIARLAAPASSALRVPASAAASVVLSVQGVAFGGFFEAIRLEGGSGHRITGSHFGPGIGQLFPPNRYGVRVDAPGVTIGGIGPESRNVFAGNDSAAIELTDAGAIVRNNYIGTSRDGASTSSGLANLYGIIVQLGATDALVTDNVISGNDIGVYLLASAGADNVVSENRIGLAAPSLCGLPPLPACGTGMGNRIGIRSSGVSNMRISGNTIANSAEQGIFMQGNTGASWYNRVSANRIYGNGALGFDRVLVTELPGPDANGNGQPTQGVNRGQNHPVIAAAGGGRRRGVVSGTLLSSNGTYRVEMFSNASCDASGHGEGQTYHGHANVQTVLGGAAFSIPIGEAGGAVLSGRAITLTAIKADGNTSEFSACATYACDQIFGQGFDSASSETCAQP